MTGASNGAAESPSRTGPVVPAVGRLSEGNSNNAITRCR